MLDQAPPHGIRQTDPATVWATSLTARGSPCSAFLVSGCVPCELRWSPPHHASPPRRQCLSRTGALLLSSVPWSRQAPGLAALIIGGFVVGICAESAAIISSYSGMFDSVRCFDPNVPACTGLYYYYGIPGVLPLSAGVLGLAVIVTGIVVLSRSFQRPVHGH